jgi:hypothetical protein
MIELKLTALGPRTRAPLGMKTTNAKTKGFQTPGLEKDIEKTQPRQTSNRKPKKVIHADTVKLEVHGDESPLAERDVEYCPPKPKDLPYESEDFPNNCLNYDFLKNGNLMRGIYRTYHDTVDENGLSRIEREAEAAYQKASRECDERVLKMMEEEWTVGDVPETFRHLRKKQSQVKPPVPEQPKKSTTMPNKGPATIASRKAASVLSVAPKSAPLPPQPTKAAPKPSFLSRPKPTPLTTVPSNASTMRHTSAVVTSRSTIGYTKGRSASGVLHQQQQTQPTKRREGGLARTVSNMSQSSDITITPARFAEEQELEYKNPAFMRAFEVDDEDLEVGLRGGLPECLRRDEEEDEEFVMTLGTGSSD